MNRFRSRWERNRAILIPLCDPFVRFSWDFQRGLRVAIIHNDLFILKWLKNILKLIKMCRYIVSRCCILLEGRTLSFFIVNWTMKKPVGKWQRKVKRLPRVRESDGTSKTTSIKKVDTDYPWLLIFICESDKRRKMCITTGSR